LEEQTTLKHFLFHYISNKSSVSHFSQTKLYTNEIFKIVLITICHSNTSATRRYVDSPLKGMNETEMKNLGMKMSIKDIYDVNQSSMKDAVHLMVAVLEVISPKAYYLPITTVVILKFNRTLQLRKII
jgi:hypothetical protein